MVTILDCATSSFPQTYLGLPLSPTRPPSNTFLPILERYKKFLTGWRAKLLTKGDRILITAVLDSILTYYMSVFLIPKNVLETIDALKRAFFWTAEDTCSGAQCLIAWKNVCKPKKKYGGLGIKNMHVQNVCLLLKFAVKSLLPINTPWLDWLSLQHPNAFVAPASNSSYLCKTMNNRMPTLQKITFVLTNNGTSTYFWFDTWLTTKPLAITFPNPFSRSQVPMVRVANIWRFGLESNL
jgi:hypothetical protein